jgi:hypothetical protein
MINNIFMYFRSESREKGYQLSTNKNTWFIQSDKTVTISDVEKYFLLKVPEVVGILDLNLKIKLDESFFYLNLKCSIMLKVW